LISNFGFPHQGCPGGTEVGAEAHVSVHEAVHRHIIALATGFGRPAREAAARTRWGTLDSRLASSPWRGLRAGSEGPTLEIEGEPQ
jgi:hypothetical protein